jgi:hypothetical protein
MEILAQFLLRLTFGLAIGMGVLPSKQVTSGFFRNHLYVTLGLSTLAALVLAKIGSDGTALAVAAAVLSFFGAASWLYEAHLPGKVMIWLVVLLGYAAAVVAAADAHPIGTRIDREIAIATSGLVLGLVFTAMLLGHWYLNAPGMSLTPLRRLLFAAAMATFLQAIVSAIGAAAAWRAQTELSSAWVLFIALRWSFGIVFVLALLWMSWRTLEIPNTQSATGILYVAVIGVFVGELAAALLSSESMFPL